MRLKRKLVLGVIILMLLSVGVWGATIWFSSSRGEFPGRYASPNRNYLEFRREPEGVFVHGVAVFESGELANTGEIDGPVMVLGKTASYDKDGCSIVFERTDKGIFAAENSGSVCGGLNVTFNGTYSPVH